MANTIEMRGICKAFGGVPVLKGVDLDVREGEVVALVGENGAGKSTLMRILTGIYSLDEGEILYGGKPVSFHNAKESSAAGIQIIHQEFNLFPNLSVAENIFLDNAAMLRHGLVDWKSARKRAEELVRSIGGSFDVNAKVSTLTVQNQQIVEIVKALASDAKVLIMDEPTSALPENEVQNLFHTIRALKQRGVAIVYVSHRLNEIFEICDRIAVLRDGMTIAQKAVGETTRDEIIHLMVGRDVGRLYPRVESTPGEEVLAVSELGDPNGIVKGLSFSVRAGEILGLYGLMGSGANFVPDVLTRDLIDEIITVKEDDAYRTGRELAAHEGVLAGITSGAAVWAASQVAARPEFAGKNIVVILPDTGERYLSTKMFAINE